MKVYHHARRALVWWDLSQTVTSIALAGSSATATDALGPAFVAPATWAWIAQSATART